MSDLISREALLEEIKRYQMDIVSKATAMKVIRNAPAVTDTNVGCKWIPCSERLPKIEGYTSDTVLVCCSNGFQYMAFWCNDGQWRFCECGTAKEPVLWTEIIAWMPLPEPYKGE